MIKDKFEYESFVLITDEEAKESFDVALSKKENHLLLGVYNETKIVGVYSFYIIMTEKYLELTGCCSNDEEAYHIVFDYIETNYKGNKIDFVFNTKNSLLKNELVRRNVELEPETQKMILENSVRKTKNSNIVLLSKQYEDEFTKIFYDEGYWTAEKILEAKDKFKTFIYLYNNHVIGYVVVTSFLEVNEPWGVFVLTEYRRRGIGRSLMEEVVSYSYPNKLSLEVLINNIPAIKLYESLGFVKVEGQNFLAAHWSLENR